MYEVEDNKLELKHGSINEGLIAIASGKGGVGKSTVTVNLAVALNQLDKNVGIIDADVHGFSVPRILGLKEEANALNEQEIIPPHTDDGIKLISMGTFVDEDNPVIWRGPLLNKALEQFLQDVHWGELDYLVLDLPPGTGDMSINIMQRLPHAETIVVTTPQITATSVAGRIGKMAEKMDSEIIGVIENMSYYVCPDCGYKDYIFGRGGGKALADKLGTQLLGELPLLTSIRESGDEGKSIITENPDSAVSREFLKIGKNLINSNHDFDPDKKPIINKQ
ncbi:MAG: Mrp/NBP35 family ATP-binding protein [Bacillota bacterium]